MAETQQRLQFLQSIVQAADEAPTVQDALRAALARICETLHWQAGRLQFSGDAGDLSLRTFWHLNDPEHLTSFRALAEERRNATDVPEALREGKPLWRQLPEEAGDAKSIGGTRGLYAFPIRLGGRLFAVMEFFAASPDEPPQMLLETLGFVSAQLGVILARKPAEDELRRSEREYRALFESAHDAVLIVDTESGLILDANQRCADVYGYTRAQLLGAKLDGVWPGADHERLAGAARAHGGNFEALHLRRDGSPIFVEVSAGPVQFRGRPAVWMSNRDVTERKRTQDALQASEERYRLLFDASPQPMWVYDLTTLHFLAVNQSALTHYGYSREEFSRMTITEIRPLEDQPLLVERLVKPLEAESPGTLWRHRKKSGEIIDVEISSHALDLEGRKARLVVANDVTDRLRAQQKLWHAAFYDALTGLPNRALFMERLGQAQARAKGRAGEGFAVLFLDLDRFKVVNDSMGHRAGDQLLVAIARRLDRIRRAGDTVARLGGDEFAFLIEGAGEANEAGRVANRVHRELSQPFEVNGQEVFTSASIGIALGGANDDHRPEDLLRDADTAMYRAKGQGAAKHAVFDITMHDRAVAVLQLENDLRRAIDREELRVEYQPIVNLATSRVAGFEALVRWQHQKRGMVPPVEFIPMAEETGIISALGRWVLEEACRQMKALHVLHPRAQLPSLSVNISGRQILQPDLVEQVAEILETTGLDPRLLRLELTESVLVENEAAASRCLIGLRQLGLKLVIDDFGTGFSSLSYLHRMPIDTIKIDASFVRTMAVDEKNRRIVETILSLGKNLGVEVIAEGVETQAQADALQRLGCSFVQGFLYSASIDGKAASALLSLEDATLPRLQLIKA
ncbi:MAG TPA: EAL domain-containing protein [Myxococcales bacterium]|nr:EAL domain-containing protein [Myxococcales bacterium]